MRSDRIKNQEDKRSRKIPDVFLAPPKRQSKKSVLLSICIVNYNTKDLLKECIMSILDNGGTVDHEIFVVDNHSQDNSVKMLKNRFPEVHLILNRENMGYARAVNQALVRCRGDYLLVLNSDTVIMPHCLEKTLNFMAADRAIGITGCKILSADRTLQHSCRSFPGILNFAYESFYLSALFPRSRLLGKPFMTYLDYRENSEVDVVLGAFMMLRRELVAEIGLFDEQFFMYSEETDFCYRAKKGGWKVCFLPDAEIIHLGGSSTKAQSTDMFIELHKSHHRFIAKYHTTGYLIAVKMILWLGCCLRLLGHLVLLINAEWRSGGIQDIKSNMQKYFCTIAWYMRK